MAVQFRLPDRRQALCFSATGRQGLRKAPGSEGESHPVCRATPPARPVIVARIDGCEVITPSEAQKVWAIYKRRGWLREMSDQVEDLGYKREFESVKPTNLSNVRFSRAQVKFYDPYVPAPGEHKAKSLRRYQLYPLGPESTRSLESKLEPAFGDHNGKSESARTRAACEGTVYDPVHDRIQNRLDK